MTEPIERRAIISGTAQSAVGRRLHRTGLDLTVEAARAAIADAGLTAADIDGISTYPGFGGSFGGAVGADVQDALRLEVGFRDGGAETSGQLGAVIKAALAVAAGLARHVLVYRTVVEGSGGPLRPDGSSRGGGGAGMGGDAPTMFRWMGPYGAASAAVWIAMYARAHMAEYGTTEEQLGWVAVNARRHAAANPKAIYTDPMTLDDYLASRMISSPFRLFDCDVPCDGATAVIVSHRDHGTDCPHPVVGINAVGTALRGRPSWDQWPDLTTMPAHTSAAQLWSRTDLAPTDVDTAQLYDGFTWLTMCWLEALGFCGRGEAGPFVEGGDRIGLGGELPVNTAGGQLSAGRLHGFGFLHEAVLQLQGRAEGRQVEGAEVAAVAAGGGPEEGCLLLTRGVS